MPTLPALVSKGHRKTFQPLWVLGLTSILALALCGCSTTGGVTAAKSDAPGGGGSGKGGRRGAGGDVPVTVAKASMRDVPVEIQVIGNVEAYSTITVKALVGGEVTNVYFKEGDFVKKSAKLFDIDRRPLEAAYNQAVANIARDQASLLQAQANMARDEANAKYQDSQAKRYGELFQAGVISKDQAEQLRAGADASAQAVNADQLGNVVTANNMDMMTINQVEPIYVTFSVPEANLPAIKKYMALGSLVVRSRPQDADTAEEERGALTFVDNTVDITTGTIKLKGTFPNTDHKLWPGQFVRVTLLLTTQSNAVVVPNQAIQTGQTGAFIYVVKEDKTVETRPVVAGARVGQDMVVNQGIDAGETVVIEGQLRLAPGSKVVVRGDGKGGAGGGRGRRG
jgi:multidrug efflux system membrane fusion protein